jgi:glycosyltransferase involved in cell wall biosynthesis
MKQKLLSICIPAYNRKNLLEHSLIAACEASVNFSEELEIVVSDNASQDDLFSVVEEIKHRYKKIKIVYNRNDNNIGGIKNVLKVINIASGKYCWVVGSDDFIKQNGVKRILNIINQNKDINFISCNYDHIFLNEILSNKNNDKKDINLQNELKKRKHLVPHRAPIWSKRVDRLDKLIDPLFNNVLLGAVMTGIFRKSLWNNINKSSICFDNFNNLKSIYPHCFIYAKAFLGKPAFYCGEPLITVGEGAREWTTECGNDFWETALPLIYFNIFGEMVETYKKFGLDKKQYYRCKNFSGEYAGNYFLPIIIRKHIFKKNIKNSNLLNVKKTIKFYFLTKGFYKGIIKSILRPMVRPIMKILMIRTRNKK